jgi:hypothetical protein
MGAAGFGGGIDSATGLEGKAKMNVGHLFACVLLVPLFVAALAMLAGKLSELMDEEYFSDVYQLIGNKIKKTAFNDRAHTSAQHIAVRILELILPPGEERDNVVGDLLEETNLTPLTFKAHLWLYKQAVMSALPLRYRNIKGRLASYFGERIR